MVIVPVASFATKEGVGSPTFLVVLEKRMVRRTIALTQSTTPPIFTAMNSNLNFSGDLDILGKRKESNANGALNALVANAILEMS